jgi:cation diffusion facilitator CzcD-associated flavoprotein CzcO
MSSIKCELLLIVLLATQSLRANLPTAVMQLRDFAYSPGVPSYPSYHELGEYLTQYAAHFGINKVVRFHSTVTKVSKTEDRQQWKVEVQSGGPSYNDEPSVTELFDNLVICNGHYSKPFYVPITGIEHFRGEVMHSQKYRTPHRFVGKVRDRQLQHFVTKGNPHDV